MCRVWPVMLLAAAMLQGCSDTDAGTGRLRVGLVDAPAMIEGLEALTVTFAGVSVHASGSAATTDGGWIEISGGTESAAPPTFDLLQLVNGVEGVLAIGDLTEGRYTQVRIIIQSATLTINGVTDPLTIPSGEETGIKLVGPFAVTSGLDTELTVDFDAGRSIRQTATGYQLSPTFRVVQDDLVGKISGTVLPVGIGALVAAYEEGSDRSNADNIITSTFVDEASGEYVLQGLEEGSYDLEATAFGYTTETELAVPVTVGGNEAGHDFTLTAL